jgi:hypothetical protein
MQNISCENIDGIFDPAMCHKSELCLLQQCKFIPLFPSHNNLGKQGQGQQSMPESLQERVHIYKLNDLDLNNLAAQTNLVVNKHGKLRLVQQLCVEKM